jgi:probable HAF family extracellular repeat protein
MTFQLAVRPARAGAAPLAGTTASAPSYTVEDLGVFADGGGATLATGINAAGDVSGYGNHGTGGYTAFRWSNGTLTDLGSLGCGSQGNGINAGGTVVGYSNETCAESDKAGVASNGNTLVDIGNLFARPTVAYAVNTSGQIVGSSVTDHGTTRGFITGAGGTGLQQIDLLATNEPPGAQTLAALGVNDGGDAVGSAFFSSNACGSHDAPFLYMSGNGTIEELGGLDCSGQATAINNSGVAVGFEGSYAFRWDGAIHDLGLPPNASFSQALAINNPGVIVGASYASNLSPPEAWIYGAGGLRPLNDLIDASLGWDLRVAAGINDSGQIAGYGAHSGQIHAFRLTPVAPHNLTGITVTPATPTIPKGAAQRFTATGTYSDGTTADLTGSVSWSSSNSRIATIDSSGLLSTHVRGTTTVTATAGSISGSTLATVGPKKLVSLTITPANPTIPVGATEQFAASGTYTDGSTIDLAGKGYWRSSRLNVATIDLRSGLATAKKKGTLTITLHYSVLVATTSLTVGVPTGF